MLKAFFQSKGRFGFAGKVPRSRFGSGVPIDIAQRCGQRCTLNKKADVTICLLVLPTILTLGILVAGTSGTKAVFFAFFLAGVTGEEAGTL